MLPKGSLMIGFSQNFLKRNFTTIKRAELYRRCYEVLGVAENSDQNTVRRAYIDLVKRVHPDSGHDEANVERFQEVDECFKFLMEKHAKARRNIEINPEEEVKVFDIRHIAPQHRQYLTYGGFGTGTPFQRQKQYQQRRVMQAQENVLEHRMQKVSAADNALVAKGGDHFKKHGIKTKYGFERVVEDLIQEAMSKGDFKNLTGAGKPLKDHQSQNPYVDFTTHKMNKILLENGFTPEWIMLQKEILSGIDDLKKELRVERAKLHFPIKSHEEFTWQKMIDKVEATENTINRKIDKYNYILPRALMQKQMVHIRLETISEKILKEEPTERPVDEPKLESQAPSDYNTNLFSLIESIMKKHKI